LTTLDREDHETLARWAADCAERILPRFEEQYPDDNRPRQALEAARSWSLGQIGVSEARSAAFAAHAAARDADDPAACAAARAAGHAAATAHVADHARHASDYAVEAATYAVGTSDANAAVRERKWQVQHLPEHLRSVAQEGRYPKQ